MELEQTKKELMEGKKDDDEDGDKKEEVKTIGNHASPTHLASVLLEAKKQMQSATQNNGVTFALIGSSGSGKSTLIRDVFLNDVYGERADKEYIITLFTESPHSDAFKKLPKKIMMDRTGVDHNLINWYYQMNNMYDRKYNFVAVLDDCIQIKYQSQIEKMFLIMRNTNISSVVSLQYAKLIPRSIRTSVYFVFCMHQNTPEGAEIMIENYLSGYVPGNNKCEKIDYYTSWTEKKRFFVIDNLSHKVYQVDENYNCLELPRRSMVPIDYCRNYEDDPLSTRPIAQMASSMGAPKEEGKAAPPSEYVSAKQEAAETDSRTRPKDGSKPLATKMGDVAIPKIGGIEKEIPARKVRGEVYKGTIKRAEESSVATVRAALQGEDADQRLKEVEKDSVAERERKEENRQLMAAAAEQEKQKEPPRALTQEEEKSYRAPPERSDIYEPPSKRRKMSKEDKEEIMQIEQLLKRKYAQFGIGSEGIYDDRNEPPYKKPKGKKKTHPLDSAAATPKPIDMKEPPMEEIDGDTDDEDDVMTIEKNKKKRKKKQGGHYSKR